MREEIIKLLELDKAGMHVATYLTELPSKEWLKSKLQKPIEQARKKSRPPGEIHPVAYSQ